VECLIVTTRDVPAEISFILPCYGDLPWLPETLRSLARLAKTEFLQLVLVDDGCGATGQRVIQRELRQYLEYFHVKLIRHPSNYGLAAARNTGVAHSDGNYIVFLDSDDTVELLNWQEIIEKMDLNEVDASFCSSVYINDADGTRRKVSHKQTGLTKLIKQKQGRREFIVENWDLGLRIPIHSSIFRKKKPQFCWQIVVFCQHFSITF
jgi:glycosyltransferase involved in cell wall biosynthesis